MGAKHGNLNERNISNRMRSISSRAQFIPNEQNDGHAPGVWWEASNLLKEQESWPHCWSRSSTDTRIWQAKEACEMCTHARPGPVWGKCGPQLSSRVDPEKRLSTKSISTIYFHNSPSQLTKFSMKESLNRNAGARLLLLCRLKQKFRMRYNDKTSVSFCGCLGLIWFLKDAGALSTIIRTSNSQKRGSRLSFGHVYAMRNAPLV